MIPLRATESVKKFPKLVLGIIGIICLNYFLIYIVRLFLGDDITPRDILESWALGGQSGYNVSKFFSSLLLHENIFALWITTIYLWSFAPRLFERRPVWLVLTQSFVGTACAVWFYFSYHGESPEIVILLGQVFISALLGVTMKGEIWSTVNTLVFGPKIFQVFEVPSYVLLFFWFFYIMLGNLFMSAPFSEAPTLYFLPLVAFLVGFLLELVAEKFLPNKN